MPEESEFRDYLQGFMRELVPKPLRDKQVQVFRGIFDLDDYDFSDAKVQLVASVNGRLHDSSLYGTKRIAHLLKSRQILLGDKCKIWCQASSIGKVWPRFLQGFYYDLTGSIVSQERINDRFGLIYPTESYVRKSHLGIYGCECCHLKTSIYSQSNFPRGSFYRLEPRIPGFDRVVSHSKMIVATRDEKGAIDDDTLIYFGSHNFSSNAWGKEEK
jgi:tyrosyl-DNA phosphodiesterase 1